MKPPKPREAPAGPQTRRRRAAALRHIAMGPATGTPPGQRDHGSASAPTGGTAAPPDRTQRPTGMNDTAG